MATQLPSLVYQPDEALYRLYNRSLATPLPNYNSPDKKDLNSSCEQQYDVIVAGAGPAGLTLAVLLARCGLRNPAALLCVEPRHHPVASGHADGVCRRTIEMFKELGLYEDLMKVGNEVQEIVVWAELPGSRKIQRLVHQNSGMHSPRVSEAVGCAQGQIERILEGELRSYAPDSLRRGSKVIDVVLDEQGSTTHPVVATVKDETGDVYTARCRFLIGADGAHSIIRKRMAVTMIGDLTERVWGVIDFAVETDFPDIRRLVHIHRAEGSLMVFPREQNNDGYWLSRFYVDMEESIETKAEAVSSRLSPELILDRISRIFHPYRLQMKAGTKIEWFSEYTVRRCVASEYAKHDSRGIPRIFLTGDACHTHSPKLGQGMNVSMADSYNLAWKLAHAVLDITSNVKGLLDTYMTERHAVGTRLVQLDETWNRLVWSTEISRRDSHHLAARSELVKEASGFISGNGIQYAESYLTKVAQGPNENCALRVGGRIMHHVPLKRFADGLSCDLHGEIVPNGRWKVLIFAGQDLQWPVQALYQDIIPLFLPDVVTGILIMPESVKKADGLGCIPMEDADWTSFPLCVKQKAEMKVYISQAAYELCGISVEEGALVLLRPDGVISMVDGMDAARLTSFLRTVVKSPGVREHLCSE
ncbi:hypothetical protein FE257_001133 [Aspergillus nanangensis]|uniref:Uncharacterized protein n=1 Tax=Aspergillus nanangensis TaxID=2582783 RepID=A0AAD4CUD6_ASPNN|nr:hypothetical protein FE257_001133 [Aspergillus nanangensis]